MAVVIRPKYINLTELSKNCVHVVFQTLEEEVTITTITITSNNRASSTERHCRQETSETKVHQMP